MIYRDGVLSGNPVNQRTVHDEDAELAAMAEGFVVWDRKSKDVPAEAGGAASSEAQQAAFDAAATPGKADDEDADAFPPSDRKPGVAVGRKRKPE